MEVNNKINPKLVAQGAKEKSLNLKERNDFTSVFGMASENISMEVAMEELGQSGINLHSESEYRESVDTILYVVKDVLHSKGFSEGQDYDGDLRSSSLS